MKSVTRKHAFSNGWYSDNKLPLKVHSPFTHSHSPLHHAAPFPCGHSAQEFASWFPQFTGSGIGGCVVGGWVVGEFVVETMENEIIRIHKVWTKKKCY